MRGLRQGTRPASKRNSSLLGSARSFKRGLGGNALEAVALEQAIEASGDSIRVRVLVG